MSLRLSCYFAALFFVIGVYLPFWPVFLQSRGMGAAEIGLLLALAGVMRVIANPLVGHIADRSGKRRRVAIVMAAGALVSFAAFAIADGFIAFAVATLAATMFFSPLMPLGDSLTLAVTRARGLDYGRIRLWGSVTFILGSIAAGRLLAGRPEILVLWLMMAALAATLAAALLLPRAEASAEPRARVPPFRHLLADHGFLLFLAAAGLLQASHAVYYGFASLHWRAAGIDDRIIGLLWGVGVAAEIALFAFSGAIVRWLGPMRLFAIGALAGVVRWTALGLSTDVTLLFAVQLLHALTFGATHLAAMHFIMRAVPAAQSATALGLYGGLAMGLALGVMMAAAGWLYDAFAGGAFYAMAAVSALALALVLALARTN
jgi:MFS transporter, PPP family, 3-phenylpropionic acid transporter